MRFTKSIENLFAKVRRVVKGRRMIDRAIRPITEQLEARQLLAGTPLPVTQVTYQSAPALMVQGTDASDRIYVSQLSNGSIQVSNGTGWAQTFAGSFKHLIVDAKNGHDRVTLDPSVTVNSVIYGRDGNDIIRGGSGNDRIYGGLGSNVLDGAAGDDILVTIGGGNNDMVTGGSGRDQFWVDSDSRERVMDADSSENSGGYVHRVDQFYGTKVSTQQTTTKVTKKGKVKTVRLTRRAQMAMAASGKELLGQNLADPAMTRTAVKYTNFSNRPLFADNGPGGDDIVQGQVGDCYFLAVLSDVAQVDGDYIRNRVVDLGDGTYAVQFEKNGQSIYVRVDGDLPTTSWGSLAFADFGKQGSLWVSIVEKAYAFVRTGAGTYKSLDSGWMDESYTAIGLPSKSSFGASSAAALMSAIDLEMRLGKSVTFAVGTPAAGAPLVGYHAYAVDAVLTDGNGNLSHLRLRNPWGIDGAGNDGANDAYVTITAAQAKASFLGFTCAVVA